MIAEEDFDVAAEVSPEMAFVRLERKFRADFEAKAESRGLGPAEYNRYRVEYMNLTVSAARALGVPVLIDFDVPNDIPRVSQIFPIFQQAVDRFAVETQITHVRNGPKDSVALDSSEKTHLRAYADRIKEIIDKSSLEPAKKERLFDRINAFIAELDKDRTPLQRFNDVILSLANTGAEAAEELEPAWKWVKLAARILGVRQETEQTKLPAPPKRLEPPKRRLPSPPNKFDGSEMNDEVPF